MAVCCGCDQLIVRGDPREYLEGDPIHVTCNIEGALNACPHPCNLIHAGVCEF